MIKKITGQNTGLKSVRWAKRHVIARPRTKTNRKHKHCPDCQTVKLITEFYKNRSNYDGYADVCKKCSYLRLRNWQKKNKRHVRNYAKKYRDNGYREKHNENQKKYAANNKEKIEKYMKKYYQENKDKWK